MFTNISWTAYIVVVALLLVAWYLFIGLRYYSNDLKDLFLRREKPDTFPDRAPVLAFTEEDHNYSETHLPVSHYPNDPLDQVEELSSKLREAVAESASKNYSKEEFISLLRRTVTGFPELIGSPFKETIHDLILSECEKQGFIHLMAVELEIIWEEV